MKKTIGILGGMGPLATADIFRKIVLMTEAGSDNEHIRIYIDNDAQIPDRTACIVAGGPDPVEEMTTAIRHLEACGADCLIMPCNTAHHFLPRLQALTEIPFISMIAETAKTCAAAYPGQTGAILGTKGTLQAGVYSNELEKQGLKFIVPDEAEQDVLMHAIYSVKAGIDLEDLRTEFEELLEGLKAKGADYFILGCTELPLVTDGLKLEGNFCDPTSVLAKAAIEFCGYSVKSK